MSMADYSEHFEVVEQCHPRFSSERMTFRSEHFEVENRCSSSSSCLGQRVSNNVVRCSSGTELRSLQVSSLSSWNRQSASPPTSHSARLPLITYQLNSPHLTLHLSSPLTRDRCSRFLRPPLRRRRRRRNPLPSLPTSPSLPTLPLKHLPNPTCDRPNLQPHRPKRTQHGKRINPPPRLWLHKPHPPKLLPQTPHVQHITHQSTGEYTAPDRFISVKESQCENVMKRE